MPRHLIRDSFTGSYGFESEFTSLLRKSMRTMLKVGIHNRREYRRYEAFATALADNEKQTRLDREQLIKELRMELLQLEVSKTVNEEYNLCHEQKHETSSKKTTEFDSDRQHRFPSLSINRSVPVNRKNVLKNDVKNALVSNESSNKTFHIFSTDTTLSNINVNRLPMINETMMRNNELDNDAENCYNILHKPKDTKVRTSFNMKASKIKFVGQEKDDNKILNNHCSSQFLSPIKPIIQFKPNVKTTMMYGDKASNGNLGSNEERFGGFNVANCKNAIELRRAMRFRSQQLFDELSSEKERRRRRIYRIYKNRCLELTAEQREYRNQNNVIITA